MEDTFNYVVVFNNNNVKTGITKHPFHRLKNYLQESIRSNIKIVDYCITPPSRKNIALSIEKKLCEKFADQKIDGLKEWFDGGKTNSPFIFGINFSFEMNKMFNKENLFLYSEFSKKKYSKLIERANFLGKSNNKFNPKIEHLTSLKSVYSYEKTLIKLQEFKIEMFKLENGGLTPAMLALKKARELKKIEV